MPEDDLIAQRRRKVDELAALGVPSYNVDFKPDATLDEARTRLVAFEDEQGPVPAGAPPDEGPREGPTVRVAGRIVQLRLQGRVAFAHIEDEDTRLQLWLKSDRLGEQQWNLVKLLDLGDIVAARGPLTRTRRGEPSVLADEVTLLVKALRPPPEKFHGLQDTETRFRKRYLDLLSHAEQRRHFATRSRIVQSVRRTLDARGYLEVETPMLLGLAGGASARPFRTHWNALDTDVYLRIAIELHLKRLLVGGYRRVYEIGRVFRNEGLSPRHNPEFTMLEAYEAYADYDVMRELTEAIIVDAANAVGADGSALLRTLEGKPLDLTAPFRTARMADLIAGQVGFDAVKAWDDGTLRQRAEDIGVVLGPGMGDGAVFMEIYEQKVEHTLWDPTFVLDYPAEVSPLARRRKDDDRFVERFELVVAGRELANAFSELNDPIDQRRRFEDQVRKRAAGDEEAPPLDEDFLEAIETGMPPAGGLGIGIDRLVMLLTDSPAIREVLLFPQMRPTAATTGEPPAEAMARREPAIEFTTDAFPVLPEEQSP
ncbi:MAG TPA: lysine--tRNA ligase [Candidatus Dormibacteraeota bacterium]|nr:lysine--tRNA ligase [Candidatus Dormibacteraeota bacterium]